MPTTPRELAVRWFEEVWNKKSEAAIDEMFHPSGKAHGFPDTASVLVGPEAFKTVHRNFLGAFPDIQVVLDQIVAEGDAIAVRFTATMTHLGPNLGIPATGKRVSLEGASFMTLSAAGGPDGLAPESRIQIVDGWNYVNMEHLVATLQSGS